jgi:hypothetical protein
MSDMNGSYKSACSRCVTTGAFDPGCWPGSERSKCRAFALVALRGLVFITNAKGGIIGACRDWKPYDRG